MFLAQAHQCVRPVRATGRRLRRRPRPRQAIAAAHTYPPNPPHTQCECKGRPLHALTRLKRVSTSTEKLLSKLSMQRRLAPAQTVKFRDFEWICERTQVSVVVHAKELHDLYKAMARCNGVPVATLLANSSHVVGEELKCYEMVRLPQNWSFMPDGAGYVQPKLKQSGTPIGHSCTGDAHDSDYRERKRAAPPASAHDSSPSSPPQRAKRARVAPPQWLKDFSLSPSSPKSEAAGATQPVPIRLHRAAFLACCSDPKAASKLEIRHICGRPSCGVVSHFRSGLKSRNEADKPYKRGRASYSPESFPVVQL